ncbi:MAG: serine/threonine protein kinase [Herpetosiphonaceae bacterium]|nr:serine/threonine protein kinase [Herpetosiphonaceae bacterium]
MAISICPSCRAPVANQQARNCTQCGGSIEVAFAVGTMVAGQYRIVQVIGTGGSGQIYLAEDTRTFNRRCVLKRTLLGSSPADHARFASEAQTLTKLRHPQVPQVYAFFEEGNSAYIAMEYIAGRDLEQGLSQQLADGRFLPGQARSLSQVLHDGITVCSILEHLHSRTPPVIHCDIKPANLIRDSESNSLFLVDFGAAAVTGAGENFGTPGYAPPEQYRGQRQPASDIYALGATLYHLLTDDDPCEHPLKFPRLERIPKAIRVVIEETLAEQPGRRPTATALRAALERCLSMPEDKPALKFPSGVEPKTIAQFVAAARSEWGYAVNALESGELDRWLLDYEQRAAAVWLKQFRPKSTPDLALQLLLRRLDPSLPPVEVRLSQQAIELSATNTSAISPLIVTAHGGMASIKVINAPLWLHIGPQQLTVVPDAPECFNLALNVDRIPSRFQAGTLVLEANIGAGKLQRFKLPVSIGEDAHGNRLQGSVKAPINLWMMVSGWALVAMMGLFLALVFPLSQWLTLHLCTGVIVGITMTWLLGDDWTDAVVMSGGGGLAGVGGGTILITLVTGGAVGSASVGAFLVAVVTALLGCLAYQWLKSY